MAKKKQRPKGKPPKRLDGQPNSSAMPKPSSRKAHARSEVVRPKNAASKKSERGAASKKSSNAPAAEQRKSQRITASRIASSAAAVAAATKSLAHTVHTESERVHLKAHRLEAVVHDFGDRHAGEDVQETADPATDRALPEAPSFSVCGIGASSGGLQAMTELLAALPAKPGLAIVLVMHLSPQHESVLPELLSSSSTLPVLQVVDGVSIEADWLYVVPPNVQMRIENGLLRLTPRPADRTQYMPVDYFLRSLGEYAMDRGIGIVLSGNGSDGTAGLREIKAAGGIALAQDPETAAYDDMPRNAIASGAVDVALSPKDLAAEMVRIARHSEDVQREGSRPEASRSKSGREAAVSADADSLVSPEDGDVLRIFGLLRQVSGVDFTQYKPPTIRRRLHRRMVLHRLNTISDYLKLLQKDPDEVSHLYQDILIHVTRFFREPESYGVLVEGVLPNLTNSRRADEPIRVWVPGCATGEEPYSVAMLILEYLGDRAGVTALQVFATDVSEHAIGRARAGIYPQNIAADVSPERLKQFFTKVDGSYRISKAVRDSCIFARQDLTRDPPFSKLDLIVCRNVLIYLAASMQRRLMSVFHYSLKPSGFLMLGAAETVGSAGELFSVVDKKHRLYSKKADARRGDMRFAPAGFDARRFERSASPASPAQGVSAAFSEASRLVLDRYAPPGVVIDRELRIVQFRGQTGRFLESAPGDASHSLFKMAREGLLHGLKSAVLQAFRTLQPVRKGGLRVKQDGSHIAVEVEALPLDATAGSYLLVLFHVKQGAGRGNLPNAASTVPRKETGGARRRNAGGDPSIRLQQLQRELEASREYLQSIIQDLEAANEELQSANEEILSSNEELQSTNEELDTAKEELQSTNEELNTVNEELHGRNEELGIVNGDLVNLLASVQIAIVMVAGDLRIRRFTPMAQKAMNLIPTDVGRPISDIKPNVDCPGLEALIHEVIDSAVLMEREVRDRQGNLLLLRIRPYKNFENKIDGAVLALFDIDTARRQEQKAAESREIADVIATAVNLPLMVLDSEKRVRIVNRAFSTAFGISPAQADGAALSQLGKGAWDSKALHSALSNDENHNGTLLRVEISLPPTDGSDEKALLLDVWHLPGGTSGMSVVVVAGTAPGEPTPA